MKAMKRIFTMGAVMFCLAACILGYSNRAMGEDYVIAPSDVIEISIWGEELTRQLVVRPDGRVSYPLVGDMEVAGRTTQEVKVLVEESVRRYIPEASATVIVTSLGSLQYYVIGKVHKPGMYNVSKALTVLQALALAGGVTPFARESDILIVRQQGDKPLEIPFDYKAVKKGRNLVQNVTLERGDVIVVP